MSWYSKCSGFTAVRPGCVYLDNLSCDGFVGGAVGDCGFDDNHSHLRRIDAETVQLLETKRCLSPTRQDNQRISDCHDSRQALIVVSLSAVSRLRFYELSIVDEPDSCRESGRDRRADRPLFHRLRGKPSHRHPPECNFEQPLDHRRPQRIRMLSAGPVPLR